MKEYKLPPDMIEFLTDHPMAQSVIRGEIHRMMRNSATTKDDPKQAAKLCSDCGEYNTPSMEEKKHKYTCHRFFCYECRIKGCIGRCKNGR